MNLGVKTPIFGGWIEGGSGESGAEGEGWGGR